MDLFNNFVSIHASLANNWAVNELITDFKKVYNSVRREVLHCILIECGILMKLLRLIKIHLYDRCSKVCTHTKTFVCYISFSEKSETWTSFITITLQLCFSICHLEAQTNQKKLKMQLNGKHHLLAYADHLTLSDKGINTTMKAKNINKDPTRCNSKQSDLFCCKVTLHVSGVHRTHHQE